jgi:hypothetical protein
VTPGTYNLEIYQGQTVSLEFIWSAGTCGCGTVGATPEPVDITGYTAIMQFKAFPLSPTVLYDASPDLSLGGVDGTITLTIPASATEGFTWWTAVYDLQLISPTGVNTPLLAGSVTVTPSVST